MSMREVDRSSILKYLLICVLLSFCYFQIAKEGRKVIYNFDRFFYLGMLYQEKGVSEPEIHNKTISYLRNKIDHKIFTELENSTEYNKKIISDSKAYIQQFPFYTTKPLYSLFYSLFYKIKKDEIKASVYLNTLFYFLTFLLFWKMLSSGLDSLLSLLISAIVFCNNIGYGILQLGTPDVFSTFWSLLFIYVLFFSKHFLTLIISIVLAVLARSDNFILVSAFLGFYLLLYRQRKYLLGICIAGISYFLLSEFGDYYGWKFTFYHTFIQFIEFPKSENIYIRIQDYINVIFGNKQTTDDSESFLFLILGLIYVGYYFIQFKRFNLFHVLPLVVIGIKWLLFPALWNRFTMVFVLIFIFGMIVKSKEISVKEIYSKKSFK